MSASTRTTTRTAARTASRARRHARRVAVLGATSLAALVLAACSSGKSAMDQAGSSAVPSMSMSATPNASTGSTGSTAAGEHNATDVSFAEQMIPHHRQAVAMAELAADRASSAQVKELATKIKGAQDPEIARMSGWLTGWGRQVPGNDGMASMPGMDHSASPGHSMAGMMSDEEMAKLKSASGADFDEAFLAMMVAHHEGAVTMAKDEIAKGAYQPAKTLADSISTSQTAEITEMKKLITAG
ncbi:DUF305 domain-containing protein [Kitasatospora sp. GP82]|uniref:DUF305 domain-containing protein n=1 Tax=Kitasatospora sp. GP82 TaxID=3035089 RepID=UPI0024751605|nr:DUF305 domain-containing protein [Kitasatospora sp. GP82]MDH6125689.1 uncharacterized protein (DUF305 family) [Kitasatospora sp. GP82]